MSTAYIKCKLQSAAGCIRSVMGSLLQSLSQVRRRINDRVARFLGADFTMCDVLVGISRVIFSDGNLIWPFRWIWPYFLFLSSESEGADHARLPGCRRRFCVRLLQSSVPQNDTSLLLVGALRLAWLLSLLPFLADHLLQYACSQSRSHWHSSHGWLWHGWWSRHRRSVLSDRWSAWDCVPKHWFSGHCKFIALQRWDVYQDKLTLFPILGDFDAIFKQTFVIACMIRSFWMEPCWHCDVKERYWSCGSENSPNNWYCL